jgi:FkbM family methyltransferase
MIIPIIVRWVKANSWLHNLYIWMRDQKSYAAAVKLGTFSQHGEDSVLTEWFGPGYCGFYVDVGCSHPFRISNTYLLYTLGWSGVAIDPIPHIAPLYRRWRPRDVFLNKGIGATESTLTYYELTPSVLSTFDSVYAQNKISAGQASLNKEYKVEVSTLNSVFLQYASGRKIDLLSVDVEGLDIEILSSIDFNIFRPRVIVVEFNSKNDQAIISNILEAAGYDCDRIIGCNIFAVDLRDRELTTFDNSGDL